MSLLAIVLVAAMVWLYHRVKPVRTYAEAKDSLHYYTVHVVALVAAIAFMGYTRRQFCQVVASYDNELCQSVGGQSGT